MPMQFIKFWENKNMKIYLPPYEFIKKILGFDLVYSDPPKIVPVRSDFLLYLIWHVALHSGYRTEYYESRNPDISNSPLGSDSHFITTGYKENRISIDLLYDEDYYLKNNPDVSEGITIGLYENGRQHFFNQGYSEFRCPHPVYEPIINAWKLFTSND